MIFNDVKLHSVVRMEVAGSLVVVAGTTIYLFNAILGQGGKNCQQGR